MAMANFNLKELQKEIPFKWRIGQVSKYKKKASCLAYIDARDAMDLLDDVVGPENWQDEYKVVGDYIMAGVSIRTENGWVTKWDTGTESNYEKEKGQISDSFKRACVKWGIGRFLYTMDTPWVDVENYGKGDKENWQPVANGKRIWDLTAHINGTRNNQSDSKTQEEQEMDDVLEEAKKEFKNVASDKQKAFIKKLAKQANLDGKAFKEKYAVEWGTLKGTEASEIIEDLKSILGYE